MLMTKNRVLNKWMADIPVTLLDPNIFLLITKVFLKMFLEFGGDIKSRKIVDDYSIRMMSGTGFLVEK